MFQNQQEEKLVRRIGEVVADIAFTAGQMNAAGKIAEIENYTQFMQQIVEWAIEFEKHFDQEAHGDDYLELIDAYAGFCLKDQVELAKQLLDGLDRSKAIRHGVTPPMEKLLPFAILPLPARCALEYLSCQSESNRDADRLNRFIDHYFSATALTCTDIVRESCHQIAKDRGYIR